MAIALVQTGTFLTAVTGNITPTLPAGSTAGNLLIAGVYNQPNVLFSGPAGWIKAIGNSNAAEVEIWYRANCPSGITSAAFTSTSTNTAAQLLEFSGAATSSPVDQTIGATGSKGNDITITLSSVPAGSLAVIVFGADMVASGAVAPTSSNTGGSWVVDGSAFSWDSGLADAMEVIHALGVSGTVSNGVGDAGSSALGDSNVAIMATFKIAGGGGGPVYPTLNYAFGSN